MQRTPATSPAPTGTTDAAGGIARLRHIPADPRAVVPLVRAPHHAELADDALVAGLAVEDCRRGDGVRPPLPGQGLRPGPGRHPRSGARRRRRPGGVPAGLAGGVDLRQPPRLGVGLAADDHPQRGDRRRAGPALGARPTTTSSTACCRRRWAATDRPTPPARRRRRRSRPPGCWPPAPACRPSRRGRSCWPCSAGARPRRSAAATACRSGRRRRGSGPACAGCGSDSSTASEPAQEDARWLSGR